MLLDQSNFILSQLLFKLKIANNNRNAIFIQTYLFLLYNQLLKVFIKIVNLINNGNIILIIINENLFIKKHNIIIKRLLILKPLRLTNGFLFNFITYYFIVKIIINHYIEFILFYITKPLLLILIIFGMLWLKKHNLRLDFPVLELKFNSNYCAYKCLLQYILNYNQVVLYRYIAQLMLKYRQLTVKEVLNISELIYTVNKAEILEDQITALPLKK